MPTPLIISDLDGTLCNIDHRVQFAQQRDWANFHTRSIHDPAHKEVLWLLRTMVPTHAVVLFLTGCTDTYRLERQAWIEQQGFAKHDYHLLMRPASNRQPDTELKPKLLKDFLNYNKQYIPLFILEDRDAVVAQWRLLGYNCWQVRPGRY